MEGSKEQSCQSKILFLFQIPEILFYFLCLRPEGFSIAKFGEFAIAAMNAAQLARMFYRTPVLFRTTSNFLHIGDQAIKIAAVHAIHFFDDVQIAEIVTIKNYVFGLFDFWNAEGRET